MILGSIAIMPPCEKIAIIIRKHASFSSMQSTRAVLLDFSIEIISNAFEKKVIFLYLALVFCTLICVSFQKADHSTSPNDLFCLVRSFCDRSACRITQDKDRSGSYNLILNGTHYHLQETTLTVSFVAVQTLPVVITLYLWCVTPCLFQ